MRKLVLFLLIATIMVSCAPPSIKPLATKEDFETNQPTQTQRAFVATYPTSATYYVSIVGTWNVREFANRESRALAVLADEEVRVLNESGDWLYIVYDCPPSRCVG